MDNSDLELTYLVQQPAQPSAQPPLLILLHGVGSNELDLFGLAPYLDPRLLIVSARAPYTRAPGSYAWFAVTFAPDGPIANADQSESSRQQLIKFIGEVAQEYNADPQRIYLMGFSQGAIMSASVALTRPDLIAGAVLMSGRIMPEIKPLVAPDKQLKGLPLLVVHGVNDATLPIKFGRDSQALLASLPVQLDYREFAMGHEVSQASLKHVSDWLTAQLDAPARTVAG